MDFTCLMPVHNGAQYWPFAIMMNSWVLQY